MQCCKKENTIKKTKILLAFYAFVTTISGEFGFSKAELSPTNLWGSWPAHSPTFLETISNITGILGESITLPCRVQHLGDRSVTWMRQRDLHILTAGVFTYSADNRFIVIHPENTNDWNLKIIHAMKRDAGVYECQVNSDPKISRRVKLKVKNERSFLDEPEIVSTQLTALLSPSTEIEGPLERHIQEGSILCLTCVVHHSPRRGPNHLLWFKEAHPLDYDSPRGGVSVQTEKQLSRTVSKLSVSSVTINDSGEYSCSPTDLKSYSVTVHVQIGQHHAAIYQGGLSEGFCCKSSFFNVILSVFVAATKF